MKNYISFVNDHSGSMSHLARAAAADYNANIAAVKDAATAEMLDTVVSVIDVDGYDNPLSVVVSNPHVLKPISHWASRAGTPLWGSMTKLINMLLALPDAGKEGVSFLVMITTDGAATDPSKYPELQNTMQPLLATGRWSFVARVPVSISGLHFQQFKNLGIPEGNIQKWDTTAAGMAASTVSTQSAMRGFYAARSAGAKSTGAFYSNAAAVNVAALTDVSKQVSLYVVDPADEGIQIRDFILKHRMQYLKGAAFYQLTKTEARVSHTKQVLVRDQATGKIFAGKEARDMIGLPSDRNARLHPGDHKKFDLFIQSESINRKLVGGSGVIYWASLGVPFTAAELAIFSSNVPVAAKPPVAQLIQVPVSTKPTKSPIPVTPQSKYFGTREDARMYAATVGVAQSKIQKNLGGSKSRRWFL